MTQPSVTVVICAYNAAETIGDALASLFEQTSHGFDVIVIDDGSTDETALVVAATSTEAPVPVRVVTMPHAGLAAARNRGVDEAAGDFLAFLDADDLLAPDAIELLAAKAAETGADIVVCDMLYTEFATGEAMHVYRQGDPRLYRGRLSESPGLLPLVSGSACAKLLKRELLATSGIRFPDGRIFEDLWTVYRLCAQASAIVKVDKPLYLYRQSREGSIMTGYDDRYLDIIDGLALTNDFFAEKDLFDPLRDDLIALNFYHAILGRYTNLLTHGSRAVRRRYLRAAFSHMDRYFPGWRGSDPVRELVDRSTKRAAFTHRILLELWLEVRV